MYKVIIRPLEIADAEISWRWRNNPEIWKLTGSRPLAEITFEIESNWIEKVVNDETSKRFAILVDDVYVGNIQLTNIIKSEVAEYHIFIGDTNYWNKGIARLASLQIIRYSKNVLKLNKLVLQVNPHHGKAIKLYQSINFIITSDEIKMELELEKSPKPLVSVFVMVYNHEKYINQAIDGILMQKTNFDIEIVVGEDYSTDNSRQILLQYQNKFPGKFNLLLHEKNIGAQKNQTVLLNNCDGEYIAICEGDDYWTDPLKLQKQVDFLENNSDYSLCCGGYISHNTITDEKKEIVMGKYELNDKNGFSFTLNEMEKDWITKTFTSVFRSNCLEFSLLNQYRYLRDIHLFYHLIKNKRGYYFNSVFGVYNIHPGGVNSMQHGIVNFNANYNSFKELYFYNKDEFTRNMYLKGTLSLLSYDIYNHYPNNTIKRRIKLFKEAVLLVRIIVEIKWLLSSFFSREFKDKFKKVN